MAKALKTVGIVIAVVAIAATAVATFGTSLGIAASTVATASTIATVAGIAAGVVSVAGATIFKPKFSSQGNPLRFQTNPQSGIPYAMGRTRMSGVRIYAETHDGFSQKAKDDLLTFGVELSGGGQIEGLEVFTADKEVVTFDLSGNASGRLYNYMAQKVWTGGVMASALALTLGGSSPPGWTSAHKLNGHTHALWTLRFDSDGKIFGAGVPEPAWVGKWVRVYDPRLDSTYPGGSGPCRALDESTYVWSRNPGLHALTWSLGRWQNNKRTLGIGAPAANIRIADFVECANVCDANKWWLGGVEWSTDSKWDVLKRMLQAGGAVPTMTGAMIGCRVQTPRISVTTISSDHLLDKLTVATTKPRRDRFNTVIPRYRSEDHDWEIISGAPIAVSSYVTQDGGTRIKEIDYPLVQHESAQANVDGNRQAGQLATYDIVNSREAGPIEFTTGPRFIGIKTGDCVTLNVPEEGLVAQDIIITSATLDPGTGKISFTAETETPSKHAFALGKTVTPPPPFTLTPPSLQPPTPEATEWALSGQISGDGLPLLRLTGGVDTPRWDNVVVQYRKTADAEWTHYGAFTDGANTTIDITGVQGATSYKCRIAYQNITGLGDWFELAPVTTPANTLAGDVSAALAAAKAKGKLTVGGALPAIADSSFGDTHVADDGTFYDRVNDGGILLGGKAITLGGFRPRLGWTVSASQPLRDTITQASAAYSTANEAIDNLADLGDDGILSANEKITKLIPESARLADKWTALSAIAGSLSVSTTAASAARTAWLSYLGGLSPAWNDTTQDTAVTRSAYNSARDTYDNALYDLDRAIKAQAATLASWSGVSGSGKPADNATRNVVTYSATAPASPVDGDLWVDTSGTYAVFKLRSGGGWVTGANALSAYNALSGKPVALADINTTESSKLSGIAAGATVGAPAGTPVGSIGATDVSSTIKSGGGVANNQVGTPALLSNSVSKSTLVSSTSTVTLASNGVDYTLFNFNITKDEAASYVDVLVQLEMFGNDAVDLDVFCAIYKDAVVYDQKSVRWKLDANGSTNLPATFSYFFDGLPAADYGIYIFGRRFSTNACNTSGERSVRVREFKR